MIRSAIAIGCLCAASISLGAAQTTTMSKDKMGKDMKVTGCVAQGSDMNQFMLTNAMMSGDMKGEMKGEMKGDMKPMSYTLMGGELKPHVGHKVEVTGTMATDKSMPKDKMDKGMAEMHTLNVKSVKMIAASCP